jgi:hypothetical protein
MLRIDVRGVKIVRNLSHELLVLISTIKNNYQN